MAKENDGMRGAWHFTGQYWFCDCPGGGPVLQIGIGQGGRLTSGKAHSPNVSKCRRCGVYRPLAKGRPELGDAVPPGFERVTWDRTIE